MVNATYFTYDDTSSATYGLQIAAFTGLTPESVEENEAFSPKLTTLKAPSLFRFYHGGIEYDTPPQCQFTVISQNAITTANRSAILKWLIGRNTFKPLVFLNSDISSFTYYCVFTNASIVYVNGECHGFNLTATFDSPFARGNGSSVSTTSGTHVIQITNNSDIVDGYTYPTVDFTGSNANNNRISIINSTDSTTRSFTFGNLGASEHLIVNCEEKTIWSNMSGERLSNFIGKNWLRLRPGVNSLTVTATGNVTITCPYYAMIGY